MADVLTPSGTPGYGGAILSQDQKLPLTAAPETKGLTYIVKADDLAAARKFFEQDPYYKVGVVSNVAVRPVYPIAHRDTFIVRQRQYQSRAYPVESLRQVVFVV